MNSFRLEDQGNALWLTLERPPLNILDIPTIEAVHKALSDLPHRRTIKVLVITSAIDGIFSAGVDIKDHTKERVGAMLNAFHSLIRFLDRLPQVTVAAVNGLSLGGGCELALLCDFILATPAATFRFPEIDVGCFPPVAAALLPRIVGRRAFEMILTGNEVSATQAAEIGLITEVAADLTTGTQSLVNQLTSKSGAVLALARKAMRQSSSGSFTEALQKMEDIYLQELIATQDVEEGVQAFLQKRKPRWTDR